MASRTCPTTKKLVYTHRQALSAARWWQRTRFARMRAYKCHKCGGYHIGNNRRG